MIDDILEMGDNNKGKTPSTGIYTHCHECHEMKKVGEMYQRMLTFTFFGFICKSCFEKWKEGKLRFDGDNNQSYDFVDSAGKCIYLSDIPIPIEKPICEERLHNKVIQHI
jgi:hypothetical protein